MASLAPTIIAKSDQLNSDDLMAGPITVKIIRVDVATKVSEQPVSIHYEGDQGKPYKPGKSMRRVLLHNWGEESKNYVGRSLTLYRDPDVKFGGMEVGGIRISHMSDLPHAVTMPLTATRGSKKMFTVKPLANPTALSELSPEEIEAAKVEARKGTPHMQAWWKTLGGTGQARFVSIKAELKRIAEDADVADPSDENQH